MDFAATWQIAPREIAKVLGTPFQVYRPQDATEALVPGNLVAQAAVWITADKALKADAPLPFDKSRGFAAFDPTLAQVGDYLVGARGSGDTETWFVESMDLPAPITAVRCNRMLTLARPGTAAPGDGYYGGDLTAMEGLLLTAWPASVMPGTKGERGDTNLPGDTRLPWVLVRLPPLPDGVVPRMADFAIDDLGRRYEVSQAVGGPMGWVLSAALAAA